MKKNIVIACQSYGHLVRDIIKVYVNNGFNVTLISSKNEWISLENDLPADVCIKYVISYDKSSYVKRLLTWIICAIQMWVKIFFFHREAELLLVSNPPLAPLLPRLLPNKFSLLIWDVYPDVLVRQRLLSRNNFLVKWWGQQNKIVFEKAKKVYTISQGMKDCLMQYVDESKIKVFSLWPNDNMFRVDKKDNRFIKDQGLEGKFVVLYSGNLGITHRMDVLLDVAQLVDDCDIEYVLIGEGGKKKMIEDRIARENIKNVRLLPFQSLEMLPHSLSSADIAVITLDSSSSAISVPSKTYNLMSVGAPLLCIASPESELGIIIRENEVGGIYPPDDTRGIAQFIIKLKNNDDIRDKYSRNSLEASKKYTNENAKIFLD